MASECTALHEMPRRVLKGCCKFAAAKGEGVYELLILLTGSLLGIFLYPTHPLLLYKHGHIENAFRSSVFGEEMKGFFFFLPAEIDREWWWLVTVEGQEKNILTFKEGSESFDPKSFKGSIYTKQSKISLLTFRPKFWGQISYVDKIGLEQ